MALLKIQIHRSELLNKPVHEPLQVSCWVGGAYSTEAAKFAWRFMLWA